MFIIQNKILFIMLSVSTQNRLANTIYAIADAERQTEVSRQVLAEQALFEPYTAFRRLDQQRNGDLRPSDLIEFLGDNNITATQVEAAYLFKKFDLDRDGRISYNDFLRAVLPREDTRLRQLASLRESYYLEKNMLLPTEVEWALAKLLQQEISNYRYLSPIKAQLVNALDYTSLEAFKSLDLFNLGFITIDSLDVFVRTQGYPLGIDQLQSFFRAVDLDQDGRITYSELVEAVHLMEPLPYVPSSGVLIRQNEIERSLQRSRSLERLYLSSYPYYFYPYYPTYYPASYYPYLSLSLAELRLRESSIDRLRESRLAAIETESRVRQINNEARRSLERSRSIERLQQIELDSRIRQSRLEDRARQRELDQIRENDLRRSRERLRQIEGESRARQLEAESRALQLDRELRLSSIERANRLRQLEDERHLIDSNVRLRSLERLNSLERLRNVNNLRRIDLEYTDLVRQSSLYSPARLYSTNLEYSPMKQISTQPRDIALAESVLTSSKVPFVQSSVRRTVNYY